MVYCFAKGGGDHSALSHSLFGAADMCFVVFECLFSSWLPENIPLGSVDVSFALRIGSSLHVHSLCLPVPTFYFATKHGVLISTGSVYIKCIVEKLEAARILY